MDLTNWAAVAEIIAAAAVIASDGALMSQEFVEYAEKLLAADLRGWRQVSTGKMLSNTAAPEATPSGT